MRRSDATFFFPPSHPNVGALTSTNDGRSYRPRGLPNAYVMWKLVVRFENTRETFYQRKCREKTIDPDTCSCHRQKRISCRHFRFVPFGVYTAQKCVRSTRRCRVNSIAFASEYFYLQNPNCSQLSGASEAGISNLQKWSNSR